MKEVQESGMFSPALLDKIRDKFLYVDWDPYTGERTYFEASGGSLRLKTVMETMARETALPDELFRFNRCGKVFVSSINH